MYETALKMLMGDRAKFIMLICALAFATLLTTQQSSVFLGLMRWTTATLLNTQVPVWVMDKSVSQVNEVRAMRDTDVGRIRSVKGVEWAVPFYFSIQQARLTQGGFQNIALMGLDSTTLIGAPPKMIEGQLKDLRQANGVIIDRIGLEKLSQQRDINLKVGDTFEINDHQLKIVGICEANPSFFGYPQVYTTYNRALETVPKTRENLSFILVQPKKGFTKQEVVKNIESSTNLKALTDDGFFWDTIWWFFRNTNIPVSFGTTVLLGFIVGTAISGQTFYSFILENLGNLGALKAMGASNALLCRMLLVQAFTAGFIGYGIGLGICSIFGLLSLNATQFPFFMPYQVPLVVFGLILAICAIAALIGILKISKLDAAEVFRA